MFTEINAKVAVWGLYEQARFQPRRVKWGERVLPVERLTMVSDFKDGGVRFRRYSFVSGGNVYRLEFNRDQEIWILKEVYYE